MKVSTPACNTRSIFFILFGIFFLQQSCHQPPERKPEWPSTAEETKPWTRWWWHGSAVTKEGITAEMEAYKKAGLGGLELTPIFGVYGHEGEFINYLSPSWMEMLDHTLKEAERLDLGIDMATGTGWPFGGPWIDAKYACKDLHYKVYDVKGGQQLNEKIEFIQQPLLRLVGNQIYELHDNSFGGESSPKGTTKEPLMRVDARTFDIKQLVEPISANKNLQSLALDQVRFEKPLPLQVLMAYSDDGKVIDLTSDVSDGKLNWVAPEGNWKLYALFEGWHGKMVERAAPGGEGNVIDHFSHEAINHYLYRFDSAFQGHDIKPLRAFFNDSYEVDDARGSADWTPAFFDEFEKRRGYDLRKYLPALFGNDEEEKNKRILCDYRETISELVLDNFTLPWKTWSHQHDAIVRDQAHGSPSNILDLYAAVDIPETEGVEPLRTKMATSAGHVTGKKLISSESATWLNEHFTSNLADIKKAVDQFLVNGVNHVFYHGTAYSPPGEQWPGRLFYAAVHLNPRNPIWNDFDVLNMYITRSQSFLQNSKPDQDVLLYYPIYDRFSSPGPEMIEHFDALGRQFDNTSFKTAAELMLSKGFLFDFISDKQIGNTQFESERLKTEGGSLYKTIILPQCNYIPLATFSKIISLARDGATVIALDGLPESVSGFKDFEANTKKFKDLLNEIQASGDPVEGIRELKTGKGQILVGNDLDQLLSRAAVERETMVDKGLSFLRKKENDGRVIYFIVNNNDTLVDGWIPLNAKGSSVVLYDPMQGHFGVGKWRNSAELYVHIPPGQTLIAEVNDGTMSADPYNYQIPAGDPVVLPGPWKITFANGGPAIPSPVETDSLKSWTTFTGDDYKVFSGTGTYSMSFTRPVSTTSGGWLIDLGTVKESAEVSVNGKLVGTTIGPVYRVYVGDSLLHDGQNELQVKVSNLMANRIAGMDKQHVFWKKFYNVNFPARKPENRSKGLFDASQWELKESGLIGPVKLIPVKQDP